MSKYLRESKLENIYSGGAIYGPNMWKVYDAGKAVDSVELTTAGAIIVLLGNISPAELRGKRDDSGPARRVVKACRRTIAAASVPSEMIERGSPTTLQAKAIEVDESDYAWLKEKAAAFAVKIFGLNEATVLDAIEDVLPDKELKPAPQSVDGKVSVE